MATILWSGASSSLIGTAGNWTGGVAPGASDVAVFSSTADAITGTPAADVSEIRVTEGFTGSIGTTANPIVIDATTVVIDAPSASVHLAGTFTTVYILAMGTVDPAVKLHASTITTLSISGARGHVEVTGAGGPTNVYLLKSPKCRLTMDKAGSDSTSFTMDSGTVELARGVTTALNMNGGKVTTTDSAAFGTINLEAGEVDYRSSGTITKLIVNGGLFDASSNGTASVTVTDTTIRDGVVNEKNGLANFTYTNDIEMSGRGSFLADSGRTIAVS